jgi:hypothetical protein
MVVSLVVTGDHSCSERLLAAHADKYLEGGVHAKAKLIQKTGGEKIIFPWEEDNMTVQVQRDNLGWQR